LSRAFSAWTLKTVFDSATVAERRLSEPEGSGRVAARGKPVVACGVGLAAAIVMLQVAANLVDFGVYHYRFAFLNPNNEGNLFAWISGLVIAFAACLSLVRAYRVRLERGRYLLLGSLLGLLAVENRVRVREQSVHRPLIYVPVLGVLFVALVWTSLRWPSAARRVLWAGLASLVFSFALHKLAPHVLAHYGYGPGDWPYEVKVSLKESGEVCGWILIATGLIAAPPNRQASST
jgi:hypothetical protein